MSRVEMQGAVAELVRGETIVPGLAAQSLVHTYRVGMLAPPREGIVTVSPPTCATELVLTTDACMVDHAPDGTSPSKPRAFFFGPMQSERGATVSALPDGTRVVSVVFRPGAGPFLFRVSAHEVVDTVVDAEALLPVDLSAELLRVHEVRGPREIAAVLDRWVLRMLLRVPARARPPTDEARWLLEVMAGRDLDAVAASSSYSRRQIERRFRDAFGMNPTRLQRIERFRRASRQLVARPGWSLVQLAAACGFSDQAHMTREFRALAGVPPSHYAAKRAGAFYLDAPIFLPVEVPEESVA